MWPWVHTFHVTLLFLQCFLSRSRFWLLKQKYACLSNFNVEPGIIFFLFFLNMKPRTRNVNNTLFFSSQQISLKCLLHVPGYFQMWVLNFAPRYQSPDVVSWLGQLSEIHNNNLFYLFNKSVYIYKCISWSSQPSLTQKIGGNSIFIKANKHKATFVPPNQ